MLEVIVLNCNKQGEDTIEHTPDKCHMFTFYYTRGKYSSAYSCQDITKHP